VALSIGDGTVSVVGDGIERRELLANVGITDPVGTAPRLVRFRDGALCEVEDTNAFAALLAQHGIGSSQVTQWEGSLRWIAVAAMLFVLVLVAGYRYLLPAVAGVVADRVPEPLIDLVCSGVMTALDASVFTASEVPDETQRRLASRFAQLTLPDAEPDSFRIMFRKSEKLGPNALALCPGARTARDGGRPEARLESRPRVPVEPPHYR
jgi:hypothetical protein